MRVCRTASLVVALVMMASPGFAAAMVFDNGAATLATGSDLTTYIIAEDFVLPRRTMLTGLTFWGGPASTYAGSIEWLLFADDGTGQPGGLPMATGLTVTPAVPDGWYDRFDVPLGGILVAGRTRYWLALHNGPLTLPDPCGGFGWAAAAANGTLLGEEISRLPGPCDDTPPYWDFEGGYWGVSDSEVEHAFFLTGTPAAVPEPGTLGLLAAAGGVWLRRRAVSARRSGTPVPSRRRRSGPGTRAS